MNYYERHVGDYAADTAHLSAIQHGIYGLLMDRYYKDERPIPDKYAAAWAKSSREEVQAVLDEFFELDGNQWRHKRADEEIAKFHKKLETAAKAGKASAEQRAANAGSTTVERPLNDRSTNQTPDTRHQTKEEKTEVPLGDKSPPADQSILDAYNGSMTKLPKARSLTPKRKALIRSARLAYPESKSPAFWQAYFAECEDDAFHNGTGPYGKGHEGWMPDFDYLLRVQVITKIYERAMTRMEREQ